METESEIDTEAEPETEMPLKMNMFYPFFNHGIVSHYHSPSRINHLFIYLKSILDGCEKH